MDASAPRSHALPLVITMGDPAGIGPEIICRAFAQPGGVSNAVVVGDVGVLRRAALCMRQRADVPDIVVAELSELADVADVPPGCMPIWQPPGLAEGLAALPWGRVDARAGAAAAVCIRHAVAAVQGGRAGGIVTAPIHKEALALAGEPFPGHTEMLADLAGAPGRPVPVRMMLANEELKVVLVTVHCSLREAIDRIDLANVLDTVRLAHQSAQQWGQAHPRIAVAALNPHAGEGGLFGSEERTVIAPAIAAARAEGIDASGPHAPDTVFMRARRGAFDLVVAQYHDQGLIPVKYLGVEHGVNVTLGLPFVRTSPDHGTAFDIAGRGMADASSLLAAIALARQFTSA